MQNYVNSVWYIRFLKIISKAYRYQMASNYNHRISRACIAHQNNKRIAHVHHVFCQIKIKWGLFVEEIYYLYPITNHIDLQFQIRLFLMFPPIRNKHCPWRSFFFCQMKTKWGHHKHLSCNVLFQLLQKFQRRWSKCEVYGQMIDGTKSDSKT